MYDSRHTLDRNALEQIAWERRDVVATMRQAVDARRLEKTFEHTRVLLSRTRLRAEVHLVQN